MKKNRNSYESTPLPPLSANQLRIQRGAREAPPPPDQTYSFSWSFQKKNGQMIRCRSSGVGDPCLANLDYAFFKY